MSAEIKTFSQLSTLSLAKAVAAYLPENLVAELSLAPNTENSINPPRLLEAVTMMVDITGFTPLCEALAKKGREGAEQVTSVINLFFEEALRPVQEQGGVIAKFGGDAFIAFFERRPSESWEDTARRAIYSAVTLQKLVEKYRELRLPHDTTDQIFQLYAKVGLAGGPLLAFAVGIPEKHCDFQIAGTPLNEAAEAEHQAKRGEIILHKNLLARVENLRSCLELGEMREVAYPLLNFQAFIPNLSQPLFELTTLSSSALEMFLKRSASYIPRPIYERLKLGYLRLPGEHRRVVSLFVNFTGFDWLNDEAAPEKFNSYYLAILEVVERHGGHLNRVSSGDKGDLLHILFGAPITHSDDNERAMRCALDLQVTAQRFDYIESQKIGLSSGFVFAGDIGSPNRHEYTTIGDSVNLSARLMQNAKDWSVLTDTATLQQVGTHFEYGEIRTLQLKGKSFFVDVAEVLKVSESAAMTRRSTQQPIYGRAEELTVARRTILDALAGQVSLFAVTGEPGIGKSFFLERVVAAWQSVGGRLVRTQLVNYERRPFGVWAKWLAQLAGIDPKAVLQERQASLQRFITGLAPELADWLPLWGELLDLGMPEGGWLSGLDRPTRRQKFLEYTRLWLSRLCQQQPLMLFCDDFHCADSASLELLDELLPILPKTPLVICFGYRNEQNLNLKALKAPNCTELVLAPLSAQSSHEFIISLLTLSTASQENISVSETFITNLITLSGGNPFFIEEIFNNLLAAGKFEMQLSETDALSYNLQSVIMDRLDALESRLREVLLVASVVGGNFSDELISPLLPTGIADDWATSEFSPLKQLHQLDLLLPEENATKTRYRFRHALIQQVIYQSLPFAHRRTLHEQIGLWFEEHLPNGEGLELLSYHYEQSRNRVKAVLYLAKSAEKAARLFANSEALDLYKRALQRSEKAGAGLSPNRAELLTGLGGVQAQIADFEAALQSFQAALTLLPPENLLERAKLYQSIADVSLRYTRLPEALEAVQTANSCLDQIKITRANRTLVRLQQAQLAVVHSEILRQQADVENSLAIAENGLKLLKENKQAEYKVQIIKTKIALYQSIASGSVLNTKMDYAQQMLAQSVKLSRQIADPVMEGQLLQRRAILNMQIEKNHVALFYFQQALPLIEKTGTRDRIVTTLLPGGLTFYYNADFKQAQLWVSRGLQLAQEISSPFLICSGYYYLGRVEQVAGSWLKAQEYFQQALQIAKENKLWTRYVEILIYYCEFLGKLGQPKEALEMAEEASLCIQNYKLPAGFLIYLRTTLLEFYNNLGEFEQANQYIQELNIEELAQLDTPTGVEIFGLLHWAEHWALKTLAENKLQLSELNSTAAALQAQAFTQKALIYFQSSKSFLYLPICYRIAGLVAWARGDTSQALKYFAVGLAQAKRINHSYAVACLLQCRGLLKANLGSVKLAKQDIKKAGQLFTAFPARPDLQFLTNSNYIFYQSLQ